MLTAPLHGFLRRGNGGDMAPHITTPEPPPEQSLRESVANDACAQGGKQPLGKVLL